jgi:hypothetical protein
MNGNIYLVFSFYGTNELWKWDGNAFNIISSRINLTRNMSYGVKSFEIKGERYVVFANKEENEVWKWDGTDFSDPTMVFPIRAGDSR